MNAERLIYERIQSSELEDILRYIHKLEAENAVLAMAANNIIMEGSFSGDNITSAAELMALCQLICKNYEQRKGLEDG